MCCEIEEHIAAVKETYRPLIAGAGSRIVGGARLWRQFEDAVAAYRKHRRAQAAGLVERVNELAVARQVLMDDSLSDAAIQYEPEIVDRGPRFDFVATEIDGTTRYIEVKTIEPRTQENDRNWGKVEQRQRLMTPGNSYIVEKEWMGASLFGDSFSARSSFLAYTLETEAKLSQHTAIRPGRGVLVFCGTGSAWHLSELEDFADFYRNGRHRHDDPFATMEEHGIQQGRAKPLRTLDGFIAMMRKHDDIVPDKWVCPVLGPSHGTGAL